MWYSWHQRCRYRKGATKRETHEQHVNLMEIHIRSKVPSTSLPPYPFQGITGILPAALTTILTMQVAQMTDGAHLPSCATLLNPQQPGSQSKHIQLTVLLTGLHRLVRSHASGQEYRAAPSRASSVPMVSAAKQPVGRITFTSASSEMALLPNTSALLASTPFPLQPGRNSRPGELGITFVHGSNGKK